MTRRELPCAMCLTDGLRAPASPRKGHSAPGLLRPPLRARSSGAGGVSELAAPETAGFRSKRY